MLVLNLPFKALMFLTLMRPSLVLFLVLWLKLVKDFLKVRCRLALLPFLISCLIWLDLRSEERFSRNAETDLVCRLLLEKKNEHPTRALPDRMTQLRARAPHRLCACIDGAAMDVVFFLVLLQPPVSTLFPYTTLFRS